MNEPKIRFKGYTEAWEQRKFSDFTYFAGKRNKDNLALEPYAITNENGFIPQSKAHDEFGYMKGTDRKAYNIVSPHSFAYNPARINVGSIGYYEGAESVIVSSLYEVFQTADYVDDRFLWHWFKSEDFPRWIERLQEGSVRLYFYYDKLCECHISMPSMDEQKKVASTLDAMDQLITIYQQKCKEIKMIKRYMLQKMFPKDGESIPEIRFSGFTDAWEQRKLGEICEVTMGQSPDGSTYSDEPGDYILVQGNADLKDGWVFPRTWTTQKTKTAQAGDLIMSVRAPAGAMGKTAYDVVLGRGVAGVKGNEFVYQTLVKYNSDGYWKRIAAGSTFESVNSDAVKDAILLVPQDVEEQEKIGDYFEKLDTLITLHQRKCEELQGIKKFMMQNLFV